MQVLIEKWHLKQPTYRDFANNTEHDPTAPETTAYEKGSSMFQYGLRSCPETARRISPLLNVCILRHVKQFKKCLEG